MQAYDGTGINRLRFVFNDTVLSLGLAADATFSDVAEALSGLSRSARPGPTAIDVTVAQRASCLDSLPVSLRRRRRPMAVAAR
jgi:hypothetical protein